MSRRARVLIGALLALGGAGVRGAHAQVSATVDPVDPAYERLELLREEGFLHSLMLGERPFTRGELARLTRVAREELDSASGPVSRRAQRALEALEAEFVPDRGTVPLARVDVELMRLDSPYRAVTNGDLGYIDAMTNPLAENRRGRPAANGFNARLSTDHRIQRGRHLAAAARTALWAATDSAPRAGRRRATLEQAYVITGLGNLRIQAGRDYLRLGQGMRGGLAPSDNAPPFDMVRLFADAPFTLPWLLRHAGPTRVTAFLANLGPEQNFPDARLAGARVAIAPARSVELGATLLQHVGGGGSPPATFGEKLADFFPLIDAIFLGDRDLMFSNKFSGVDARLFLPAGVQLHGEILFDDFDLRRVRSTLWEDAGIVAGVAVPRLTRSGALRLDLEAHHMGLRMYQHSQFISGLTRDGWILGNPLGARADAGYVRLTHGFATDRAIAVDAAWERRSDDQYRVTVEDERDAGWQFVRYEARPKETRARLVVEWRERVAAGSTLWLTVGGEQVGNFAYEAGRRRFNALAHVRWSHVFPGRGSGAFVSVPSP